MIPAHEQWALRRTTTRPGGTRCKTIHKALLKKAKGRVFVMDRALDAPYLGPDDPAPKPLSAKKRAEFLDELATTEAEFEAFRETVTVDDLYYEITVPD